MVRRGLLIGDLDELGSCSSQQQEITHLQSGRRSATDLVLQEPNIAHPRPPCTPPWRSHEILTPTSGFRKHHPYRRRDLYSVHEEFHHQRHSSLSSHHHLLLLIIITIIKNSHNIKINNSVATSPPVSSRHPVSYHSASYNLTSCHHRHLPHNQYNGFSFWYRLCSQTLVLLVSDLVAARETLMSAVQGLMRSTAQAICESVSTANPNLQLHVHVQTDVQSQLQVHLHGYLY